jgi:prepilin-type N-terminal cleavage/methylation domain-containing protein
MHLSILPTALSKPARQNGFTLAEVLISTGIFVILIGIVFSNFRGANNIEVFRGDSSTLASNLRKVQSLALSGVKYGGSFPRGGYGISIKTCLVNPVNPCTYALFVDQTDPPNQHYDLASDSVVQTVRLSRFTLVKEIRVDGQLLSNVAPDLSTVEISFKPPRPTPFVWWDITNPPSPPDEGQEGKTVTILLEYEGKGLQREITVKGISGQISERII